MGLWECCSSLAASLPGPSLPLLPSLLLGTSFASVILLYLYKTQTNLPLSSILLHVFRSIFFLLPTPEHDEGQSCASPDCVRCQRYQEVREGAVQLWREMLGVAAVPSDLTRLATALKKMEGKLGGTSQKIGETSLKTVDLAQKTEGSLGMSEETEESTLKIEELLQKTEESSNTSQKAEPTGPRIEDLFWDTEDMPRKIPDVSQKSEGNPQRVGNLPRPPSGSPQARRRRPEKNGEAPSEGTQDTQQRSQPLQDLQQPTVFRMGLVPAEPYWTGREVYQTERNLLTLNFPVVLKEFEAVFSTLQNGDGRGWKTNNISEGHWCIFPFLDQGRAVEENCQRCPNVAALLSSLPALMRDCLFGNASFSILYPESFIAPHHGPTDLRLRCHLGLRVPGGCWLEVAGQQQRWKVGETIIFDDSFLHSASFANQPSNAQAQPRAVLMVDFWHPGVTQSEKECLLQLFAA